MNFASTPFILGFLPVTLLLFHLIGGARRAEWRMVFLTLASAVFYLSSGWQNGLVLAGSIAGNFLAARMMLAVPKEQARRRKAIMWAAVAGNLGLLLGFKLSILGSEGPDGFNPGEEILLPLALSFVTFQQIGFVTSVLRGTIRQVTLPRYLFFVLFFPQLILGPIIRFEDVAKQLDDGALAKVDPRWVATGMAVFCLALIKKLVFANGLGRVADPVFAATMTGTVGLGDMWTGIAAFQLQLLFDFTAYAEMSIGLAMMVGMKMPLNFDRPYFARDRAELWRRWHISFTTFIRGNVFLPLVRRWKWPVWLSLAVTGILSGLWHGLGATFVLWGLIQTGILLWLHWRTTRRRHDGGERLPPVLGIALTFLVTCLIGALFRAPEIEAVHNIYGSLAGVGGWAATGTLVNLRGLGLLLLAMLLAWGAPDFGQLFRGQWQFTELRPTVAEPPRHWSERFVAFRPGAAWGAVTAIALLVALFALARQDEAARFVYAQF